MGSSIQDRLFFIFPPPVCVRWVAASSNAIPDLESGLRNERCSPPWRRNLASSLLVGCSKVPTRQRVGLSHWIALGLSDCAAKLRSRGRNRASCVWTSGLSSQQESQNPVGLKFRPTERKGKYARRVGSALEFVVSPATLTEEQRAPGSGHATTSFSRGSPQTATLPRGNRLARRPFRQVWSHSCR